MAFTGEGSVVPTRDVMVLAFRELSRLKQGTVVEQPAIAVDGLTKYYGPVVGVESLTFRVERRRDLRIPRRQRCGQDDDDAAAARSAAAERRARQHPWRRLPPRQPSDARARRLSAGELPTYPDLSARGYLDYLAQIDGRPVSPAYLAELFARFDVSALDLRRRLRDQSHGMKQKIGIIQALMAEPAGADPRRADGGSRPADGAGVPRHAPRAQVARHDHGAAVLARARRGRESPAIGSAWCGAAGWWRSKRSRALRRRAARVVTVEFSADVSAAVPVLAGVALRDRSPRRWTLEVAAPLGPAASGDRAAAGARRAVEPFRLEDFIAGVLRRRRLVMRTRALMRRSLVQARFVLLGCGLAPVRVSARGRRAGVGDRGPNSFSRMAELLPGFLQRGLGAKAMLLATFKGTVAFGYFHPSSHARRAGRRDVPRHRAGTRSRIRPRRCRAGASRCRGIGS